MHGLLAGFALVIGSLNAEATFADGTLIFLENCNSVVEYSTGDEVAHVALVFNSGEETWIYEATPAKVRRVKQATYEAELARLNARRKANNKIRALVLAPKRPYSPQEVAAMRDYLDQQLGRRYSVKNYLRDQPGDGVHCAELASTTLTKSGRYDFSDCYAIHPAAMLALVEPTYEAAQVLELPQWKTQETWCQRADRRWGEIWTWCRWSCREAVSFCW